MEERDHIVEEAPDDELAVSRLMQNVGSTARRSFVTPLALIHVRIMFFVSLLQKFVVRNITYLYVVCCDCCSTDAFHCSVK